MPTHVAQYAGDNAIVTNTITITGVTTGAGADRAVFVGSYVRITGAQVSVTNATYGGVSMDRISFAGYTNDNGVAASLDVFGLYGAASGSNTLVCETAFATSDYGIVAITFSDVATNGTPVADQLDSAVTNLTSHTNQIQSATDRIALDWFGLFTETGTVSGDATLVTNADGGGNFVSVATVDPALAATNLLGWTWGTANRDVVHISFDVQAAVVPATNVAMVGIG